MKAPSPNNWATKEIPYCFFIWSTLDFLKTGKQQFKQKFTVEKSNGMNSVSISKDQVKNYMLLIINFWSCLSYHYLFTDWETEVWGTLVNIPMVIGDFFDKIRDEHTEFNKHLLPTMCQALRIVHEV